MTPTALRDINDVPELTKMQRTFLKALCRLLVVTRMSGVFGISLVHKHPGMDDTDVLVEMPGIVPGTFILQATPAAEAPGGRATAWRAGPKGQLVVTQSCFGCDSTPPSASLAKVRH